MAAVSRDGMFYRVYYRKRRRQEHGGAEAENGGEDILGMEDQESALTLAAWLKQHKRCEEEEEDQEPNLTLTEMLGRIVMKKKKSVLERKDLIFGEKIEGQNGKVEKGEERTQENGVSDLGFGIEEGLVEEKKFDEKGLTNQRFEENGDVGFGKEGLVKSDNDKGIVEKKVKRSKEDVSTMCHQCQRSDNGRVVRCGGCSKRGERKRYCVPCMKKWYPNLSEEDFAEACPVCHGNCNCKACMSLDVPLRCVKNRGLEIGEEERVEQCRYLVNRLLPYLKRINDEQVREMRFEAEKQGIVEFEEMEVKKSNCRVGERMYCNSCKTSIFDFHRSCPGCQYDLCLKCCWEIRAGEVKGGGKGLVEKLENRVFEFFNGEGKIIWRNGWGTRRLRSSLMKLKFEWKADKDGSIRCPPEHMEGCGKYLLELRCLFPGNVVMKLVEKSESIDETYKILHASSKTSEESCSCLNPVSI